MEPTGTRLFERAEAHVSHRRLLAGLCVAVAVAVLAAVIGTLASGGGTGKRVGTTAAAAAAPTTLPSGGGYELLPPNTVPPDELGGPAAGPPPTPTTVAAQVLATAITRPPQASPKTPSTPTTRGHSATPAQPSGGGQAGFTSPSGTAAPACRNSYDPSCGPFRWDRDPGQDQPEQITLTPSNTTVRVGENVDFHVSIYDPDNTNFVECAFKWDYDDGAQVQTTHCDPKPGSNPCPPRYGPWDPPAAQPGNEDFAGIGHSWTTAGTYQVSYTHDSRPNSCYNPYASAGTATVTITVLP